MTVWTHTQGVYPDRQGIAEMLRVPPAERSPASMSKAPAVTAITAPTMPRPMPR